MALSWYWNFEVWTLELGWKWKFETLDGSLESWSRAGINSNKFEFNST
jgi:hypothetical protein